MAGKSERVKVEIQESTAGEMRTFNITLTAPASDFLLTDLLRQRGVIDSLESELKQVIKTAAETYLSGAEILVAGLATQPKQAQKTRANGNGKSDEKEQTGVKAATL